MSNLKLDFNTLAQSGTQLDSKGVELEEKIKEISSLIASTQEAWQGQASQAYQEQWNSMQPQFIVAAQNIQTLGKQITAYANQHNEVETSASSNFLQGK